MTDLSSLIARLEQAESGSRELDLEIWNAVSKDAPWRFWREENETITCDRYGPDAVGNPILSLDQFSRSLDAAITLVPDGFSIQAHLFPGHPVLGMNWEVGHGSSGRHATSAALALVIAALKARSRAQENQNARR